MGEYTALSGGPALLLTHGPYFECSFTSAATPMPLPFHPHSPAGLWADINDDDFFSKFNIEFTDPHKGSGGFGASTAQFIAVYFFALVQQKRIREELLRPQLNIGPAISSDTVFDRSDSSVATNSNGTSSLSDLQKWTVVEDYKNLFEENSLVPSGYDVMAQLQGGLCVVESAKHNISPIIWPFADVDIHIYKTKTKLNTHEHLQNLELSPTILESLEKTAEKNIQALIQKNKDLFFSSLNEFSAFQKSASLLAPEIVSLTDKWVSHPDVFAARGCGALGADVVAVFVKKNFKPSVEIESDLAHIWSTNQNVGHAFQIDCSSSKVQV